MCSHASPSLEELTYFEDVFSMEAYDAHCPMYYSNDKLYDPRMPAYNPELGGGYPPPYDPFDDHACEERPSLTMN